MSETTKAVTVSVLFLVVYTALVLYAGVWFLDGYVNPCLGHPCG
jgi:hypothetical protein